MYRILVYVLHYKYYTPKLITVPDKEKVINEVKKLIPTYAKERPTMTAMLESQKSTDSSCKFVSNSAMIER